MGLDRHGFTRKTYSELLDEITEEYRKHFGADINLSAYTPLGILMRVQAFFYARLWDTVEAVYNSRFIRKADDRSLDYHGGDKSLPRNPATHSYVTLNLVGEPGHTLETGEQFTTEGDVQFLLTEDITFDDEGLATVEAVSADTGAFTEVAAGTINIMVEPDDKVESVTNPEPARGGSDLESEKSYRQRLLRANESKGKGTATAIETALMNVPGVRTANAVFNRTMEPDEHGNPPKSLHAYVLGGLAGDVAQALFDSMGATTQTVGEQVVPVSDLSGNVHDIRFDYAEVVPIYMRVTIKTNPAFEMDGVRQIKDAFISKVGGTDSNNESQRGLSMGTDVTIFPLNKALVNINGIDDALIEIGTDISNLGTGSIEINQHEVAETALDNIEVILDV